MRILFAADVPPDPNSGAAGTEWQTIQALRRLGHEVDEVWADDLPHRIRHGNLHYLLELPKGYRDVIRERCAGKTYDVVHVNQAQCFLAAQDHLKSRRPGVFIYRSHGLEDRAEKALAPWRSLLGASKRGLLSTLPGVVVDLLLSRQYRKAAKYPSGIIVSCSLDKAHLIDNYAITSDRVGVIPQAPADLFMQLPFAAFSPRRLKKILHIGNFVVWKGSHTVVDVANSLLMSETEATLTWVCSTVDHIKIKNMLNREVVNKINLVGWCSQSELRNIYDEHGIFLCPSLFEGFGKVFLEAMARGMCVIGTPTGGMRDIIVTAENGFLVDFHDPEGIVSAVRRIIAHPLLGSAISRQAAIDARGFSWDRVGRETVDFYQRLIELGPRHASG